MLTFRRNIYDTSISRAADYSGAACPGEPMQSMEHDHVGARFYPPMIEINRKGRFSLLSVALCKFVTTADRRERKRALSDVFAAGKPCP